MSKSTFTADATAHGVTANYSGATNTMFIGGEDKKVKTFIRLCCLKGKGAFTFGIKQAAKA